jgi:hypothetical protein
VTITNLFGQTCNVFRATKTTDGFGDKRDSWSTVPDATYPCKLQHAVRAAGTSEDTDMRDLALGRWYLYLPGTAVLSEHDRVQVDGAMYEVVSVHKSQHPRTGVHHLQAQVTAAGGTVASRG